LVLMELVVAPGAALIGRSANGVNLRVRYQINLLAISREGTRSIGRLRTARIAAGDVLMMQGPPEAVSEFAADYGCLPLAQRPLRLPDQRRMWLSVGILLAAVAAVASGLAAAPIAFSAGVLAAMATRVVPPRVVYDAIDWPVIVLLACLLPVADAMLTTGAADVVAGFLVGEIAGGAPVVALVVILVVTMTLSDVMNNAATVAVMAPIAWGVAQTLGVNPDAFFMAVAIGGSCAFLTPIGHQNNTLILGPGGFRFGDYWRLGLPLEAIVVAVGVPLILAVWGL
jgi:di/tricarboxylate transporter